MAIVRDRFIRVGSDDERSALAFAQRELSPEFAGTILIQGRLREFAVWKPSDFPIREPQCDGCGALDPPLALHEAGERVLCPQCGGSADGCRREGSKEHTT